MTKLVQFATITSLAAVGLGLTSSDARAGASAGGAICEYVTGDSIGYATSAIQINGVSTIVCAVPVDHQLGTTVKFRVNFTDSLPNNVLTCNGYAYSQDGVQLAVTPDITSSDCNSDPNPGCKDMDEDQLTVNPQSATNVYVFRCTTPVTGGNYSAIESVRVY